MDLVYVRGSHGTLTVHRQSGFIVEADLDGDEYEEIAFFDADTLTRSNIDILETGYFTKSGAYAEPLQWVGPDEFWIEAPRIAA